jgi:hypothetical protein
LESHIISNVISGKGEFYLNDNKIKAGLYIVNISDRKSSWTKALFIM